MKNYYKIIIFLILALVFGAYTSTAQADVVISNISITDFADNSAIVKWRTNLPTRSIIYFGEDANNLDKQGLDTKYDYYHTLQIFSLSEDKTYYYKIVSYTQNGEGSETFLQTFSTNDMVDTRSPKVYNEKTVQVTGDAVALKWQTNEETIATIHYGLDPSALIWVVGSGGYSQKHELFVYRLKNDTKYYIRIQVQDRAGNKTWSNTLSFYTGGLIWQNAKLTINNIKPLSYDPNLIFTDKAIITFETNLIAKAKISYGTSPKKYIYAFTADQSREFNHKIALENLKPNTTYYYVIEAYDALYNAYVKTEEKSFTTQAPQQKIVLGTKITNSNKDSDGDGLSDNYELSIKTDPNNKDSDGDGYNDGLEIANGYNPLGLGKLIKKIYDKPRLESDEEMYKSIKLKRELEAQLGKLSLDKNNWFTVVNAYIYGDYPISAIVQAIRYGGKTVHPTIPWGIWKNSHDYQQYINK